MAGIKNKSFTRQSATRFTKHDAIAMAFPLLLIVPNIALAFTEQTAILSKMTNIALPLGIYYLLFGLSRNVSKNILICLPLIIYAAFQIVLLYLYGESIIAIDMFLNVVTTNAGEINELLGNLSVAITTVCILYLPPIAYSIYAIKKGHKTGRDTAVSIRRIGYLLSAAGVLLMCAGYILVPKYNAMRETFPVNVVSNMSQAIQRYKATANYHSTSEPFDFKAISAHPPKSQEIYMLVIGETSRAENWQLCGYDRETNPCLSKRKDVIFYDKVLSESNTTHKSVPLILSPVTARTFGDSIYSTKSLVAAFRQAGFHTAFISNQRRNHSFIDFFADEADRTIFISDDNRPHYDHELIRPCIDFITECKPGKILVILHTYGSHFKYNERYPEEYSYFSPDNDMDARFNNRQCLTNAYDNSIRYTDYLLESLIKSLDSISCPTAMLYVSDHGEDIFDDKRKRFLHASPTPTYHQLHVPMLIYMSKEYREAFSETYSAAESHRHSNIASSETVFDTMLSLAGISTRYSTPTKAITDISYRFEGHRYLNDYNESVALCNSGLRNEDFVRLSNHDISSYE